MKRTVQKNRDGKEACHEDVLLQWTFSRGERTRQARNQMIKKWTRGQDRGETLYGTPC